jgi:hypothetical protein
MTQKIKIDVIIKIMRINLIIFAILHLFYVAAIASKTGTRANGGSVIIQYLISAWILRKFVFKNDMDSTKVALYTWGVSIAVFLARVLLGLLIFPLLDAR